jgi:hypothetical protein
MKSKKYLGRCQCQRKNICEKDNNRNAGKPLLFLAVSAAEKCTLFEKTQKTGSPSRPAAQAQPETPFH